MLIIKIEIEDRFSVSRKRMVIQMANLLKKCAWVIAVVAALFHVISLVFYPLPPNIFRTIHLLSMLSIIFLTRPTVKNREGFWGKVGFIEIALFVLSVIACIYACLEMTNMYNKYGIFLTKLDVAMGLICILVVMESTRRTTGLALPIIAGVFLLYAFFGQHIPGMIGHKGYSIQRIVFAIYSYDGIFSTPLETCATYVLLFITFSSFLEKAGAGDYFLDLAKGVAGRMRGGPAKVAVISSALFGMISGSAVANVAGTGSITIPMMKRIGYRNQFAGAVEAVASTGGQIMPPIMAAGAFLMAQTLGVGYSTIAIAALIPAVMYFLTIWISIDCESAKEGLEGLSAEELPDVRKLLKDGWYLLLPIVLLIFLLVVVRYSAIRSAFFSMLACIFIAIVDPKRKFTVRDFFDGFASSSFGTASVAGACACAGIVIGIMGLTGLGGKLSAMVISLAHGHLLLALLLSMLTAVVFGMGLPSTISYLLCVSVLASVLYEMGVTPIAVHMFIFYYASLSVITPPVALAAYAGAGIAEAKPIPTAFEATKLGIAAFFLPFMFVYNNAFLMVGSASQILLACLTGLCGCFAIAAFCQGYMMIRLKWHLRALFGVIAGCLFWQSKMMDMIGLIGFVVLMLLVTMISKKRAQAAKPLE